MRARSMMIIFILVFMSLSLPVLAQQRPTPPPPPGPGGGGGNQAAPEFDPNYQPVANTYAGVGSVSSGPGEEIDDFSLTTTCTSGERFVAGATGKVVAEDGTEWMVPMDVNSGAGTVDMFNDCTGTGDNPSYLDDLETVVIDEDGEVITATIFADNYFELYINGEFVGRDNINFIPFNSSVVRFQASYPLTIAVKMADWETHFGIGMEYESYNVGDGGFIAAFDNGVMTGDDWKVLPLYIAPLDDPACVTEDANGNPDSSRCETKPTCSTMNVDVCRALHYPLPDDWMMPDFDDSNWLNATLYDASEVTNQRAYVDYAARFGEAEFIWSGNLRLDNLVLARYTVEAP